ncbi:helix-turn-helix domain protein [Serratia sp. AS12]|uniref:helix-turn-helix transcriptional regulator n=1 Tax=Serratia TaxID=613 RepID=UPI00020E98E7|nr:MULTISPECIES: helix-turn-helix transcriptional regulator [Serratia]AEF46420.1 helix-turn-helix domain protein [Serratia plymuthica AS9]AEF51372.1 helix-turn-helix domain protein [Serratia sp. AS12]AEG29080.1 helix-turn-helix domain protein [Serratia sp. AS13]UTN95134.1 helix-turn-helix domain-containing protein [Serratia plymuthica]
MMGQSSSLAMAEELGRRLKQARLNANLTQEAVAQIAGVNRKAIVNAEKGRGLLVSFVSIMSALNLTGHLDLFLPEQVISPLQLVKLQGEKRQRASGQRTDKKGETTEW